MEGKKPLPESGSGADCRGGLAAAKAEAAQGCSADHNTDTAAFLREGEPRRVSKNLYDPKTNSYAG